MFNTLFDSAEEVVLRNDEKMYLRHPVKRWKYFVTSTLEGKGNNYSSHIHSRVPIYDEKFQFQENVSNVVILRHRIRCIYVLPRTDQLSKPETNDRSTAIL